MCQTLSHNPPGYNIITGKFDGENLPGLFPRGVDPVDTSSCCPPAERVSYSFRELFLFQANSEKFNKIHANIIISSSMNDWAILQFKNKNPAEWESLVQNLGLEVDFFKLFLKND